MTERRTDPGPTVSTKDGSGHAGEGVAATLFRFQSLFGLVAVFIAAVVFPPSRDGELLFLSSDNTFNVVRAVSEIDIIAVGMTFVILGGGIDLSAGAVLGLAAVGSIVLLVESDFGVLPSVLLAVLVFGLLQGTASALLGTRAFIVTLAGVQLARGLAWIASDGQRMAIAYGDGPGEAPSMFSLLGEGTFNGLVTVPAVIFVVVAAQAIAFLRMSAFSRHVYAIGGNEQAARLSGVPVVRVKVIVFGIRGLLAVLAGIIHAGQLNQGSGYELAAVAAVVVGGTALSGGRGPVVGTVAGAGLRRLHPNR
ncbi:MAG: ABC transporter permease [Actinomycetota bacterium]|nr:ABC transporter permease [Actinomycetota bacterium]